VINVNLKDVEHGSRLILKSWNILVKFLCLCATVDVDVFGELSRISCVYF